MDIAGILGIVLGFAIMIIAIALEGTVGLYWSLSSVFITIGGAFAALMVNFPWKQVASIGKLTVIAFSKDDNNESEIIRTLVEFAESSRREGLLALEDKVQNTDDEFLKKGIQLVVDGTDAELVRSILEIELAFLEERHAEGQRLFEQFGAYAPAFGMIGTLIGLIAMLGELDDPSQVGSGMAIALITTLYGAVIANSVLLPIAGRLRGKTAKEILLKEVMIEGILSIQAGENPRIVEEKLKAFLSPNQREVPARRGVAPGTVSGAEGVMSDAS